MKSMVHKKSVWLMATAVLMLIIVSVALAQNGDKAPGVTTGTQAVAGSAFTYQGRLDQSGSPVNDSCNFKFTLYDAASGGSVVGSTVTKTGVPVTDGVFSTDLDFGSGYFTGDARYLQIQVQCSGDSSYTSLSGRVALNAAPYALSLVPGAVISGTHPTGRVLSVSDTATSGFTFGVFSESNSTEGTGVMGYGAVGVRGQSDSTSGAGVVGQATATSGATSGVYGLNDSPSGYGVYGDNTASTGTPYGVYGISSDSGSATSYGVYGKSNSSVGIGVGGSAATNGVYGEATNTSGATWGVYGKSSSASGYGVFGTNANTNGAGVRGETVDGHGVEGIVDWTQSGTGVGVYGSGGFYGTAGHFENATTGKPTVIIQNAGGASSPALVVTGTTHIEGGLDWKPVVSYVSIPAAAFRPYADGYSYTNDGHTLTPSNGSSLNYLAEVQLPHGANISNFTFYWTDGATADGSASLYRINLDGTETPMAIADTNGGGPGSTTTGSSSATTLSYPTIDNSQYSYYIWLNLPLDTDGVVEAHGVVIQYTISQPY